MAKRFLKAKWRQDTGDLDVFIDEESIERIIPMDGGLRVGLRGSSEVYIVSEQYTYTTDDILDLCKRKTNNTATSGHWAAKGYCGGLK